MMINSFEINIFRDSSDQYFECKYFQENPTIKFNKKTVLLICDRQGISENCDLPYLPSVIFECDIKY